MFKSMKALGTFIKNTDKIWLIPSIFLLVIVALLVVVSQISPVPVFLYPLI